MSAVAVEGLELDVLQREVVGEEITALLAGLHTPKGRAPWGDLAVAVEGGAVPEPLLSRLESVLEMSLQTGRARKIHGAEGEQALLRLFHKTPRGAAARRSTEAVNAAPNIRVTPISSLLGEAIARTANEKSVSSLID